MKFKPSAAAFYFLGQWVSLCDKVAAADWELKAEIYPDDPVGSNPNLTPDYGFGWSVDYSGDTLIAGSYRAGKWDQDLGAYLSGGGSARVYVRTDSTSNFGWEQQGPPLVVNDSGEEYVGYRVAIDGDRAIIAAGRGQGFGVIKLFLFERSNGSWAQTGILEFPDAYNDNGEMPRVALEGDIAVVGRPFPIEGVGSGNANGKVFIYQNIGGNWNTIPEIIQAPLSTRKDGDYFGVDVAISNGNILVGADEREAWESTVGEYEVLRKGKAYIFVNNNDGNGWLHSQTLEPDIAAIPNGFRFGSYLALDGDNALVGNNYQFCDYNETSVYRFTRNADKTWQQTHKISSSMCGFGKGIALKGNQALIGSNGVESLYLFDKGTLVSLYPFNDHYGYSESSSHNGNWLVLGTKEAFVGRDRGYWNQYSYSEQGSIHVYDSFSEIPLGEEVVSYDSTQAWGTTFSVSYNVGHGRQVEVELFKSDCSTLIDVWGGIISRSESVWRNSLTHDRVDFYYYFDPTRLDEIGIYKADTWQLDICHRVRLVSSPSIEDEQSLLIDVDLIPEGVIAGSFGDPHIITFDKLKFDCQAAGVFTTLTSLDDDTFKIQERFTAVSSNSCSQASVSTGVAITDTGKPIIQISTPGLGQTSLNDFKFGSITCPIDFFINGVGSILGEADLSGTNVLVRREKQDTNQIKIVHTDTLLTVDVVVRLSQQFGCHIMVQVGLPDTFRVGQPLVGLLGTPNGDMTDDWLAPDGSAVQAPATEMDRIFSTAYDYCVENWCVQASTDSLFRLRDGETFDMINKCGLPYSGADIESAVQDIVNNPSVNQVISNICMADNSGSTILSLSCVVDGLCGAISDAYDAINDQWNILYSAEDTKSSEFSPLKASSPAWEAKAEISPNDSSESTPNLSPDYGFGWSVAVSNYTIIVGSYNSAKFDVEAQSYGPGQGSARVFARTDQSSNLSWEQVGDPLVVHDVDNPNSKYMGYRVAMDGPTALIAATRENGGVNKSKVFVFEFLQNGAWEQTAVLPIETLDDGRIPQVALQGDTAVVGAGYFGNGRVFVFKKLQSWSQVEFATLVASDGKPGDYFGADVSVSGNVILVGASQQDLKDVLSDGSRVPAQVRRGKAYIFVNSADGNGWVQEAIIKPDHYTSEQLEFGAAVSLSGDTAFIGHGNFYGNAYVFRRGFGDWTLQEKLNAPRASYDSWTFGKSVAVNGNFAIVGGDSGVATLFERARSGWTVKSVMRGYYWSFLSRHGRSVALGTDFAVVAADSGETQVDKVQVFDDFSIVPPGDKKIDLTQSYNYSFSFGVDFFILYTTGYTHAVKVELFEKDCQTSIPGNLINTTQEYHGRYSVNEDYHYRWTRFDPKELEGSVLHNQVTWEVEICAVASLVDSPDVSTEDILSFPFFEGAPPGALDVIFERSWTSGNGIWASYLIGRDQEHMAQLFQKDCSTPVVDTSITVQESWVNSFDYKYEMVAFGYTLDSETVRDSIIFNSDSSEIEVCHVVTLVDDPNVVDRHVLNIFVAPARTFAGLFGDPHITTFDELSYDCQAAGEFTTLTSLENGSFKIQERFTAIESAGNMCVQASVSTGVVVTDTDKPIIQISTPRYGGASSNTVNGCPIDFYIDGTSASLDTDLSSSNIEVTLDDSVPRIRIEHKDSSLTLDVVVGNSGSFGCHIMVQVSLSPSFHREETLLGLLGTPNGDKFDDWRMPNGTIITAPTSDFERLFSTAYQYCVENWCAKTASESLFVYRDGESFDAINKCNTPFSNEVEVAVIEQDSLDQGLVNVCGGSLVCLVDGLCGDIADALSAIGNEQEITTMQEEAKTASIFPRENVEVQDVQAVTTNTSSTASSTTGSDSTSSTVVSTDTTGTTDTSYSTTSVPTGIYQKFFNPVDKLFALDSVTTFTYTISNVDCNDGDSQDDNSLKSIVGALQDWLTAFSCFGTGDQSECAATISSLMCMKAYRANGKVRGRNLAENNDLIINFKVTLWGYCQDIPDCTDGPALVEAVGKLIQQNFEDSIKNNHNLSLLQALDNIFSAITSVGSDIKLGDIYSTLLARYTSWYPNWGKNEDTCKNDGHYEVYMKQGSFIKSTLEDCCNSYYWWTVEECLILGGAHSSNVGSEEFYVDYGSLSCKQSCLKKDASATKNCGGLVPQWEESFKKAEDCCATKLFWVDQKSCIADSTLNNLEDSDKGSKKWFVDWSAYKCVKDCVEGTGDHCGGIAQLWDETFDTSAECCKAKLHWIPHSKCTK